MERLIAATRYGYALGRWQAAWRFASPELRQTVALAQTSAAWDVFRRDDVGPAHEPLIASASLMSTDDPRRDCVLLWLADHGALATAAAARLVVRMVGATKRFGAEQQDLLQVARDAMTAPPVDSDPVGRVLSDGSHRTFLAGQRTGLGDPGRTRQSLCRGLKQLSRQRQCSERSAIRRGERSSKDWRTEVASR